MNGDAAFIENHPRDMTGMHFLASQVIENQIELTTAIKNNVELKYEVRLGDGFANRRTMTGFR